MTSSPYGSPENNGFQTFQEYQQQRGESFHEYVGDASDLYASDLYGSPGQVIDAYGDSESDTSPLQSPVSGYHQNSPVRGSTRLVPAQFMDQPPRPSLDSIRSEAYNNIFGEPESYQPQPHHQYQPQPYSQLPTQSYHQYREQRNYQYQDQSIHQFQDQSTHQFQEQHQYYSSARHPTHYPPQNMIFPNDDQQVYIPKSKTISRPLGPRQPPSSLNSSPEKSNPTRAKTTSSKSMSYTVVPGVISQPKIIEKRENKTVISQSKSLRRVSYVSEKLEKFEVRNERKSHENEEKISNKRHGRHTSHERHISHESHEKRISRENSEKINISEPALDLPSLPFSASSLTSQFYKRCFEIWSLSKVFEWCKTLNESFNNPLISKAELIKSLKGLIHSRYSRLPLSLLEDNVDVIIEEFEKYKCISYIDMVGNPVSDSSSDGYVVFNRDAKINGVMAQLSSCYSTKFNHRKSSSNESLRKGHACYALFCPREPKNFVPAQMSKSVHIIKHPTGFLPDGHTELGSSWSDHWNFTDEELEEMNEATVLRQSHIFDLIKAEQRLATFGRLIIDIYGDSFASQTTPLLEDSDAFYKNAFLSVIPIIEVHRKYLLEPFIAKLKTTKFISGFSEFYSQWYREAYAAYVKYVKCMVDVRVIIDNEKLKENSPFTKWITQMDADPRVKEVNGIDHKKLFNLCFVFEILNLRLTLVEVLKHTPQTDPEYKRTEKTIKAVKKIIENLNYLQGRASRSKENVEFANSLIWRSGKQVHIDWESPETTIIKQGQVSKKRDLWLNSYSYLILINNYLLITDEIKDNLDKKKYKVVEDPISLSFLLVEIPSGKNSDSNAGTALSNISDASMSNSQDPEFFPFKIRNTAINRSFTFYTTNASEHQTWLNVMQEAQAKFFELERKNEPFKLRILADAAFSYGKDGPLHKVPLYPKNSTLDLALQEAKTLFPGLIIPRPLMHSKVNVSETFYRDKKRYVFVGLDFGVFLCEYGQIRSWARVLELKTVTQIKALEEFNVLVVLAEKILQFYKLDQIFAVYKGSENRTIGQKLSKQSVNFFGVGHQRGSTLLFYCKQKVSTSVCNFKVLVPKLDGPSTAVESFEEHKKFNIQADCYDLAIFNSTFSIFTNKGIETLSLELLRPSSIPRPSKGVLTSSEAANEELIRKKLALASCKPIGLFKINDNNELLLVYNEFAIICDKTGWLTRFGLLQFSFKVYKVAFQDDYLIVEGKNVIEIFRIEASTCALGVPKNDLPIQVISANEVSLINTSAGNVTFCMMHPKEPGRQLVVSLELKE